ncbi:protein TIC 22, chloroplastic-like [Aristolochia californica]|uniref:protein TIC 22, chloroplastic-like n=1 Tax=Aristolochia californica TaxID=171875 RepID=UPI0035D6CC05
MQIPCPSFPLSAMDPPPNPFSALSSFLQNQLATLGAELAARLDDGKRFVTRAASALPVRSRPALPFAAVFSGTWQPKHVFDIALSVDHVAKTLAGTSVYTVSNSSNEFVLMSDPNSVRSLSLLCFRHEDAEALLAQVQLWQPVLGKGARVVPITLEQVYMLKVEGIAFRFLPDPLQLRNALELKAGKGFDGVPIFQSDLLVVKKKNKRYYPIYFQKEDIERELAKLPRASRGSGLSQQIMVGSLEDVLKRMEMSNKNSNWEDLIFIPPGKSYVQQIKEVAA